MREFINLENGNIVTEEEMILEAIELYDLDDPTNLFDYSEYYIPAEEWEARYE